jgi:hypothetical protein
VAFSKRVNIIAMILGAFDPRRFSRVGGLAVRTVPGLYRTIRSS